MLTIIIAGKAYNVLKLPDGLLQEKGQYQLRWQDNRTGVKPEDYCLLVSNVELKPTYFTSTAAGSEIRWLWEPEFFAGTFHAELYVEGSKVWPVGSVAEIIVNAELKKVTQQQFQQMVEELAQLAFSLSPAYYKSCLGKGRTFSLVQLELIVQYSKEILRAVDAVARNPRKKLLQFRRSVPLHQVKQSDEQALLQLVTHSADFVSVDAQAVPPALSAVAAKTKNLLFSTITEVDQRVSFNTYENGFVKGLLLLLITLINQLLHQLSALSLQEERLGKIATSRLEQLRYWKRQVRLRLELPFLQEVEPVQKAENYTITLAKHPDYRRLYQYYHKLRYTSVPLGQESLPLSVERTYQLYEYWCFMKIAGLLIEQVGDATADVRDLFTIVPDQGQLSLRLKHGEQSKIRITDNLSIYFQRHYPYYRETAIGSYSFQMIPDIVLERSWEDGSTTSVILDPKYRVARDSLLSALGDMHKYKDALVDATGQRIITAAYILVPREPNAEDLRTKYLQQDYQLKHGLGIVVLSPGEEQEAIALLDLLSQVGIVSGKCQVEKQ